MIQTIPRSFTIESAVNFAAKTCLKNFWFLLILHFSIGAIPAILANLIWHSNPVNHILTTSFQMLFIGGFLTIILDLVDGHKPNYSDLFSKTRLFWKYLGAYICCTLLWGAGLLALIVPGIIAMVLTCFYGLVIAEEECGPIEALKRSAALTRGCRWKIFGFFCALFALSMTIVLAVYLLAAIPAYCIHQIFHLKISQLLAGIGLLCFPLIVIFGELAWAHCYRQLSMNTPHAHGTIEDAQARLRSTDDRYAKAIQRLALAVALLKNTLEHASMVRSRLTDCTLDSLHQMIQLMPLMGGIDNPSGADIREFEHLPMLMTVCESVVGETCSLLQENFFDKQFESDKRETYERWIPTTINTGTVEWSPEDISTMASGVNRLAIELENISVMAESLAKKFEKLLNSSNWEIGSWSDQKLKAVLVKVFKDSEPVQKQCKELQGHCSSTFMYKLQLNSMPNQIKWYSMSAEERTQL